jgi:RNA polymerase sigma-70 factor (ECF subfamily)
MDHRHASSAAPFHGGPGFPSTHWSVVVAAREPDSARAASALATLCQTYWQPVYAYLRRKGHDEHGACDLAQEFFCRVIERPILRNADRERGRFRSFLLGCLEHFLAKEWNRARRQKRGGGRRVVSVDAVRGELCGLARAGPALDPVQVFERRWAMTVIEEALSRLRREYAAAGKADLCARLEPYVTASEGSYSELALASGMSEGALRVAAHRLRRRYGACLREVVAETVADPAEIDDEIRELFAALG